MGYFLFYRYKLWQSCATVEEEMIVGMGEKASWVKCFSSGICFCKSYEQPCVKHFKLFLSLNGVALGMVIIDVSLWRNILCMCFSPLKKVWKPKRWVVFLRQGLMRAFAVNVMWLPSLCCFTGKLLKPSTPRDHLRRTGENSCNRKHQNQLLTSMSTHCE